MKSVNLITKDITDIEIPYLFNSSSLISGVARIGKTTFLLSGLEEKIKQNKSIIFIHKRKEDTIKIQELAKKYNRENDVILYNKQSIDFYNKIIIVEADPFNENQFPILNELISLYSDFNNHELFLFVDEVEDFINISLFNNLIFSSLRSGLSVFISINSFFDINEILSSNINNHIYFKANDIKSRKYLSDISNINIDAFLYFSKGEFIFQEKNKFSLCSYQIKE